MKRLVVLASLLALLGLGGCTRGPSHAASAAAPSSASASTSSASGSPKSPTAQHSAGSTSGESASASASQSSDKSSSADQTGSTSRSLEHLAPMPASEQLPQNAMWKPGVNYDVISPAQPTSAPAGQVEVMEVFWLGCPHCYAFEPYIRAWLKHKPSYVKFVRVPVMWGPVHRLHAHLFYTLEALNRDDLVEKAFQTIHNGNPLIGDTEQDTYEMQLKWAQRQGVSAKAFSKAYHSFSVQTSLEHAQDITQRYHVTGVPDIIVAGKYQTDVGKADGHTQLIKLIDFLAAYEHRHERRS